MRFPNILVVIAAMTLAFTSGCGVESTVDVGSTTDAAVDAAKGAVENAADAVEAKASDAAASLKSTVMAEGSADDAAAADDAKVDIPESLAIGDKAPKVYMSKMMTGTDPVNGFEKGKVYVVEFWATWCGPCLASMPHMSGLQEEYGDKVRFIGFTEEDEATVQGFLDEPSRIDESKTWAEALKYSLVLDDEGMTSKSYMAAAKQGGIPTAFVVGKDGHLEWLGHPMDMDEPLSQIVEGTFDREAAVAEFAKKAAEQKAMMGLRKAMQSGDTEKVVELLDEMLESDPENINFLMTKAQILAQSDKTDEAIAVVDKVIATKPEEGMLNRIQMMKFGMLVQGGKGEEANTLAAELSESMWDDSMELNGLAWSMATEVPGEMQDLPLALKIAKRAVELEEGEANSIDTLARVHYEMGELQKAIDWQKKAVEASDNPAIKATLEGYEAELELQNAPADEGDDSDAEADSDAEGDAEEEAEASAE